MPSPFPGMDPWLEGPEFWEDFHRRFITYLSTAILGRLPDAYDARIDERLTLVTDAESSAELSRKSRVPDVEVSIDIGSRSSGTTAVRAEAFPEAAVELQNSLDELQPQRLSWIEVRNRDDRDLVTVIEVLSPSNKRGAGWVEYDARRKNLIGQGVNLVEIDLQRAGWRVALPGPIPPAHYYNFVTRASNLKTSVYPISLRSLLPSVPIPLRAPDDDIVLPLQSIFNQTFDDARYIRVLRYGIDPVPPLDAGDVAWARELLKPSEA